MLRSKILAAFGLVASLSTGAAAQSIEVTSREDLSIASKNAKLSDVGETGVLFAQVSSYNDAEPANARIRVKNNGAVRVRVQRSDNVTPTPEDIDIISFVGDPADLGLTGETGSFETSVNSREQRFGVDFANTYEHPVMFVQVIYGGSPITAQPVFVETDGALVSVAEAAGLDGVRAEDIVVNWAVFEAGHYTLPDGRAVTIGAVDSATTNYDMDAGTEIKAFYEPADGERAYYAADAAIFAQAQRSVGNAWQAVRMARTTEIQPGFAYDDGDGPVYEDDVEVLTGVTVRHTRDAAIEGAQDEPTVGVLGYMMIGELSGTYDLTFDSTSDTWLVAEGSTDMDISISRAVISALGGDPDVLDSVNVSVKSSEDGLSVVRMKVISLAGLAGEFMEDRTNSVQMDSDFEDAMMLLQYEFSDGTSAFYAGGSGQRLSVVDGEVDWVLGGSIGRDERFRVIENSDGTVSLHTCIGYHLTVNADGSLGATGTDVGDDEKFTLIDLTELAMAAAPNLRVQMADMDGDGSEEMMLFVEQDDGTGYFLLDPLGIADTMYKAGYKPDDSFVTQLSPTQQAALASQLDGIDGIDGIHEVNGPILKLVIDIMDADSTDRSYTAYDYEYVLEGAGYEDGVSDGLFGATFTAGEYSVMVEFDEFGPNFDISGTVYSVQGSLGGVLTGTVSVGTVYAAVDVNEKSFTAGAGAELISVTVMVGDEDGSYSSVSAGVGVGASVAAAWGENGQYGATIDLPIVPVAVAVYVKGEDVENAAAEIADWTIETYGDVADFAEDAWGTTSDWTENAAGDVSAAVENTYNETRVAVSKVGNKAIVLAEESGNAVAEFVEDVADDIEGAMNDVADALGGAFYSVSTAMEDIFKFNWL